MNAPLQLKAKIGAEIGLSDWISIDQAMIDRFADLTDDHQFIHVDPEAAALTPFGGTIAHGFLVLSMLAKLGRAADFELEGVRLGVNYGFDRVRIMAPVRSGKRIRGRFLLRDLVERASGQWLTRLEATVEIEDEPKPALIADWLIFQVVV